MSDKITQVAQAGRLAMRVGQGGVAVAAVGASGAAVSAATVILAAGGAVALAAVGFGVYKWMAARREASQEILVRDASSV